MINFFHDGNNIGFSISGVFGLIFLCFLIYEMGFFIFTRTFTIHKIYLSIVVRRQIKLMIPKWWKTHINFIFTNKRDKYYGIYVKFNRRFNDGRTVHFIKVNSVGKIIESDFVNAINQHDQKYQSEIKQWLRNKALEDIGI